MHAYLYFNILLLILQSCFGVHPGDPFPVDRLKGKYLTSEDLINANEIENPIDDEFPSILEPLLDPSDSVIDVENLVDYAMATSTEPLITTKVNKTEFERKNSDRKLLASSTATTTITTQSQDIMVGKNTTFLQETSTLLPIKTFSQKNLVKVGRWKYVDQKTKDSRYWYELEGGHMGPGWTFDGFIFQAYNKSESDTEPIYGFHSEFRATWTNTIQIEPRPPIIGSEQWIPDGVVFYAFRTSMNSTELQPVLRYWKKLKPGVTDATETRITYLTVKTKDRDIEDRAEWVFDKILFYVLPIEYYTHV